MPVLSNFSAHEADMEYVPREDHEENLCPQCHSEPEWFYVDEWGEIVGCSECLSVKYMDDV